MVINNGIQFNKWCVGLSVVNATGVADEIKFVFIIKKNNNKITAVYIYAARVLAFGEKLTLPAHLILHPSVHLVVPILAFARCVNISYLCTRFTPRWHGHIMLQ